MAQLALILIPGNKIKVNSVCLGWLSWVMYVFACVGVSVCVGVGVCVMWFRAQLNSTCLLDVFVWITVDKCTDAY